MPRALRRPELAKQMPNKEHRSREVAAPALNAESTSFVPVHSQYAASKTFERTVDFLAPSCMVPDCGGLCCRLVGVAYRSLYRFSLFFNGAF